MTSKWIYRQSDGVFLYGGFYDAVPPRKKDAVENGQPVKVPDYDNYGVVEFPDADPHPDVRLHRFDPVEGKRLATAQEIAAADDAALTERSEATSRQKDILATCALIVRARNITGWNGMTLAQKKTATLAEADVWRDIRVFIEKNL